MITVERVTLAVASLALVVAFIQLRSANKALDANNAFLVESTLLNLGVDALGKLQGADQSAPASKEEIENAFLRLEATLVVAQSLKDKDGLDQQTWDSILDTQCDIFEGNFDYLPDLEKECASR